MTKRKSIVSKLLLLMVILTLISCCFLGNTFARYISKDSGSASITVAKWDVKNNEGDVTLTFDKLSPDMDPYTSSPRTNSTGKIKVAELVNGGDVDANVTFTFDDTAAITYAGGSFEAANNGENKPAGEAEVQALFSIKFYYSTTDDAAASATTEITSKVTKVSLAKKTGVAYVYAEVIWSSDDAESGSDAGRAADQLDTWVGMNVTNVSFGLSYEAVQATQSSPQA